MCFPVISFSRSNFSVFIFSLCSIQLCAATDLLFCGALVVPAIISGSSIAIQICQKRNINIPVHWVTIHHNKIIIKSIAEWTLINWRIQINFLCVESTLEVHFTAKFYAIYSTSQFILAGFALLPFVWLVNALWFFDEAFRKPEYEEQKDIKKCNKNHNYLPKFY